MKFNLERADKKAKEKENQFFPIDLNEGNVQAIFNRCLAKPDTKDFSYATLFPTTHGYKPGDEIQIQFDSAELLKNKQSIKFLFGQLQEVHASIKKQDISIDDYNTTYNGKHWTSDKGTLLKFLYLGVSPETLFISPFNAKSNTSIMSPQVKPTLSPKDPNFPEWWEEHKSEWEEPKKEGQEPADD